MACLSHLQLLDAPAQVHHLAIVLHGLHGDAGVGCCHCLQYCKKKKQGGLKR